MPITRSRRYSKIVNIGVYSTDVLMVIGGTAYEAAEELAGLRGVEPPDMDSMELGSRGMCLCPPDTTSCAIWLPEVPETPEHFGTVAHECLHATANILTAVGVQWTTHGDGGSKWVNDEAYCYLVGFLTAEYCRFAGDVAKRRRKGR